LDTCSYALSFGGAQLNVSLWDTGGSEDYSRLRALSYPKTDIFLVCFSVVSHEGFDNIRAKWAPEVRHFMPELCPGAKMVLVGTKIDLRDDPYTLEKVRAKQLAVISRDQGTALAKELGMVAYAETSSKTGAGVDTLFRACCVIVLTREGGNVIAGAVDEDGAAGAAKSKCVLQ
jgi:Ras-related C3 botulinum toxin substrate 1